MRKAIIVVLTLLIACWSVYASGPALSQPPLSEMTEAECIEFIQDSGVTIPQQFADDPTLGASIKDIIQQVEADPNVVIMYNYSVSHNFFNAVKAAVLAYHGITDTSTSTRAVTSYVLQENRPLTSWQDSYADYNCYSFALGITNAWCDLGVKCGYPYEWQDSIAEQADLARADIIEFGYPCVKITTTRPTYSSVPSGATAICIRQVDGAARLSEHDLHFMKLTSAGWHHKPSKYIPMMYLRTPSNSVEWLQEYQDINGPQLGGKKYNSDIYYLIYSSSHYPGSTVLTGNNYHSGVFHYYEYADECTQCGELVNARWSSVSCDGPPCPILTSLSADEYIYIME